MMGGETLGNRWRAFGTLERERALADRLSMIPDQLIAIARNLCQCEPQCASIDPDDHGSFCPFHVASTAVDGACEHGTPFIEPCLACDSADAELVASTSYPTGPACPECHATLPAHEPYCIFRTCEHGTAAVDGTCRECLAECAMCTFCHKVGRKAGNEFAARWEQVSDDEWCCGECAASRERATQGDV